MTLPDCRMPRGPPDRCGSQPRCEPAVAARPPASVPAPVPLRPSRPAATGPPAPTAATRRARVPGCALNPEDSQPGPPAGLTPAASPPDHGRPRRTRTRQGRRAWTRRPCSAPARAAWRPARGPPVPLPRRAPAPRTTCRAVRRSRGGWGRRCRRRCRRCCCGAGPCVAEDGRYKNVSPRSGPSLHSTELLGKSFAAASNLRIHECACVFRVDETTGCLVARRERKPDAGAQ